MFVSLTFPFADFRGLHPEGAGRLTIPAWGKTDLRAHFARGFGAIHERAKSGIGYVGESHYADCQNFIRYPTLKFVKPLVDRDDDILMYPIYRRFFFDGVFSGRYELGFRLNYGTIDAINSIAEYRGQQVRYDVTSLSQQVMLTTLEMHLLDGREEQLEAYKAGDLLRDGYLLSSTKKSLLHQYDIAEIGSKYVQVGHPFVVVRANPETPVAAIRHHRRVLDRPGADVIVVRSGISGQGFDTLLISSPEVWGDETPQERLCRLVYTQLRTLLFAYKSYLDRIDEGHLEGFSTLQEAIAALLKRIVELSPIPENQEDDLNCRVVRELVSNLNIDLDGLADEISKTLKSGWLRRHAGKVFKFFDRKSDVAIEAAASAATNRLLGGM